MPEMPIKTGLDSECMSVFVLYGGEYCCYHSLSSIIGSSSKHAGEYPTAMQKRSNSSCRSGREMSSGTSISILDVMMFWSLLAVRINLIILTPLDERYRQ